MITGECPYCDGVVINEIADTCPAFSKHDCEHCGKTYWLRHSRIDPMAYSLEDFDKEFEVNEETKTIKKRNDRGDKSHV